MKFILKINVTAELYTTVVTAFCYVTHDGWCCAPCIILKYIFQCSIGNNHTLICCNNCSISLQYHPTNPIPLFSIAHHTKHVWKHRQACYTRKSDKFSYPLSGLIQGIPLAKKVSWTVHRHLNFFTLTCILLSEHLLFHLATQTT